MTWNTGAVPAWFRQAQWKAQWSKRNGVHYVGDDVIIDLTLPSDSNVLARTAEFDYGVDEQIIATSHRGHFTPYAAVTGEPKYSSTHAYGSLAARFDNADDSIRLDHLTRNEMFWRCYLYATQLPAGEVWIAGSTWGLGIRSDGRPQFVDQVDQRTAFSTTLPVNQWVRFEWRHNTALTTQEYKMFAGDSTSPIETASNSTAILGAQHTSFGMWGTWGASIWIDNVVAASDSWTGPYDAFEQIANPVSYTVRDYYGRIVSQGMFEESNDWFVPSAPSGGWKPGWYRVYLNGSQTSTDFYDSYGTTNFCVVRDDPHFVSMPSGPTVGGYNTEGPDLVMKGVMGLGTSRLIIWDAANYAADLANAELEVALTKQYWTDTGIPDTERPTREPWCTFPFCDGSPSQLAGVTAVVSALYPDCKYFEGPSNEPAMTSGTATAMQAFAAAVHAGNASAKAIGPCPVELGGWTGFLDAGGGAYCDEISFHAYNAVTAADLNLGRYSIQTFKDLLATYGLGSKPLWQTESVGPHSTWYGIYHPRRARWSLLETLLWEQMGVPRERNNWWYDTSHGFWDVPVWCANADGSLDAAALMARVLAEETWGKPYDSALTFGEIGDAMYLGSVYQNAAGESVVVLMATSYMTGASVALTISGTSGPITVVDGLGRETSRPLSQGRLTLPMTDVPVYVRLPVGASASVYRINGHSPLGNSSSISPDATTKQVGGVTYTVIGDDGYMTHYASGIGIAPDGAFGYQTTPSYVTLIWPTDRMIGRVVVWCGPVWQYSGTLVDFDVETYDGATWTVRKTVTKPSPPWFDHGSDSSNTGCFQETFWDEQWVFDVELDSPLSCQGVRLNVRQASYGGEPLSSALIANGDGGGQGNTVESYRIQEVAIVDDNRYIGVA